MVFESPLEEMYSKQNQVLSRTILHLYFVAPRATLCFFPPVSELYEPNGWICRCSPSHKRWPLQQILVAVLSSEKALDIQAYLSDLNTAT